MQWQRLIHLSALHHIAYGRDVDCYMSCDRIQLVYNLLFSIQSANISDIVTSPGPKEQKKESEKSHAIWLIAWIKLLVFSVCCVARRSHHYLALILFAVRLHKVPVVVHSKFRSFLFWFACSLIVPYSQQRTHTYTHRVLFLYGMQSNFVVIAKISAIIFYCSANANSHFHIRFSIIS